MDEFGEKLLEELDYTQEARNIQVRSVTGFLACDVALDMQ